MKPLYILTFLSISISNFLTGYAQTDIIPKGLINPSFGVNGGDIYANPKQ